MTLIIKLLLVYLIIMNVYVFFLMRIDKRRATKDRRHRIPEKKLLGLSLIGGALGGVMAMRMFRHKTKHTAFALGMPLMLVLHVALVCSLIRYVM
ncbi:uncharacterized membrane protein YsdA (DUF1294 family) [Paenibacillus taihuensis]|uniref:Uncharacterized membrane protein YsdA (DUF1294 family) n=1 Tax=Paenibacillus taihuensis TaxID=1156355 RepID=A0A3D9SF51_9BACL|nr:DUF1294 domain-containing protein [Paenibacillus taihuensis]REE94519.1 uncharacterized membrane protein YsdA (DUF1294 family) [Paenibacillus taihuensis]